MGFLGLRLKGNSFRFVTDVQFIQCITILFGLFNLSVCLFEDQIGKFDWKQNYVGQIKFAHFDTVSTAKKIILATEENVVAALNLKSGHILWRQVLEKAQHGQIQYLHVDSEVITVSGNSPWLVRTWDPTTGRIISEWSLMLSSPIRKRKIEWFVTQDTLTQVVATESLDVELTSYDVRSGQNNGTTTKVSTPWMTDLSRCVLTQSVFACLSKENETTKLYYMDFATRSSEVHVYPVDTLIGEGPGDISISALPGIIPGLVINRNNKKYVILLEHEKPRSVEYSFPDGVTSFLTMENGEENVLLYSTESASKYSVAAINMKNEEIKEFMTNIPEPMGTASLYAGICATKRDKATACRFLVSSSDCAISLIQNTGKVLWSREEALSHIVAIDLLDLPVSDLDASIETEFDTKEGDFLSMLSRRLSSQMNQLHLLLTTVLGGRVPQSAGQEAGLVRDEFGLHKIIVAATKVGKLFGIDNLSGKILWKKHLENVIPFSMNDKETMILYVQRTTRHFPRPAQCCLVARDKYTFEGILYMFNPITGEPIEGTIRTATKIKQALLLPKPNDEFLKEVLVLDENGDVDVYPKGSYSAVMDLTKQIFLFTADSKNGILVGYTLAYSTSEKLIATPVWQLKLGTKDQHIKSIIGKTGLERVHSQGRVLVDRSVLYKYVNPNLVAVVTHGSDPVHKYVMNIYLVDVVSGAVIFSISHKRAKEPIHVVHSENWLVYSYFNDKWRRTEIGTLELYEGKTQSNSTAFSSLSPPLLPMVERQSYILPAQVDNMQVTITEKGITSKHVLMALNNGGVIEMPWMFLDPRRPATVTPEMREEGVVPYIPELPLPYEAIINYNQSLSRIRGIHASPSGLESTCLVVVHGLDIFYTRVAPSKTFDLLKEDFDYSLIVIVLLALLLTSYITKQFASRKALKQAWK